MKKKTILILIANPQNTPSLGLLPEINKLEEAIQRSLNKDYYEVKCKVAVEAKDLRRHIIDIKPHIVHYCGHATEKGLLLHDENKKPKLLSNEFVVDLLKEFNDLLECVVLNACETETLAELLANHLDYAISMKLEVQDNAAIAFSRGFYAVLGAGESIEEAFNTGKEEVLELYISRLHTWGRPKFIMNIIDYLPKNEPTPALPIPILKTNPNPTEIGSLWLTSTEENILIRYLNIDVPLKTEIEKQFSIFVQILIEPEDVDNPVMEIQDFDKSKLPEIEIVLRANNFEILGSNTQILSVSRDADSEVRFSLIPKQAGEQKIRVDCYQNGRRIGTYKKKVTVVSDANSELVKKNTSKNLPVKIKTKPAPPPDLELCIELDYLHNSNHRLRFTIHSEISSIKYHHLKSGEVTLPESPQQKLQRIYQELGQFASTISRKFVLDEEDNQEEIKSFDNSSKNQQRRMQILGNQLWKELIPNELKHHYWKFRSEVSSLLITSDEPWIPWEMVKPYRIVNGKEEQDPFWCEQFAISRWLSSESGTIDELKVNTVIPIAPLQSNLPSVQEEINFVQQLMRLYSKVKISPPLHQLMDILESFNNPELSILHFACHGMFDITLPDDSVIKLSATDKLSPSDLPHNFYPTNPLIFINACHGSRMEFQFTKIGGWAEKCVNAEVSAFIGAMWEVNDKLALQFAKKFYELLLTESTTKEYLTIAEAFRQAREYIKEEAPYNSTWLSYTLYADPEARITQDEIR